MKHFLIIFISIACAVAHKVHLRNGIQPQKLASIKFKDVLPTIKGIDPKVFNELEYINLGEGHIEADVTDYSIKILKNIAQEIIRNGLDPLQLPDEKISLFPGSLKVDNGWIEELSTITVSDAVLARYTRDRQLVELTLPISFETLMITYDYHFQVLLVGIKGNIDAKISNLKVNLHMGFNFTSMNAFVDKADIKNSGTITFHFTGLGLLDWMINMMSGVLTTLFHGLIINVVDMVIYYPVQSVVSALNIFINSILDPK